MMFDDFDAVKNALISGLDRCSVLVVGDLMLDCYLAGKVSRISPEAPVPVVRLERRSWCLGGAANVANNLATLGVSVSLAGYLGDDLEAERFHEECRSRKIGCDAIFQSPARKTTSKTRILGDRQQLVRIDDENDSLPDAEEEAQLIARITATLESGSMDAVILSDYAKGVATPTLCAALTRTCRRLDIPVFVDPKGVNIEKYRGVTAIKPNQLEIQTLARAHGWSDDVTEAARSLCQALSLDFVALTLGPQGITLVTPTEAHPIPTLAREVYDVSGAGDTVIATMVAGLCSRLALKDAIRLANVAAAEVISHVGTTPIYRADLMSAVQTLYRNASGIKKRYELADLMSQVIAWRRKGEKIALTNGCFDLLHAGHARLLQEAARTADHLIVAVNSDESVRRLNWPERPIMPQEERLALLSALECVEALIVFDQDTPEPLIEAIRPDFLVKGGDYTSDSVVGASLVASYGGQVVIVPLISGLSSSRLAKAFETF